MPRSSRLLATLLALCVVLGACSSSSDAPGGPERTDSTSGSDAPGTATPTEPEAAGEEAVMVGDFRHRPACRLLTPEDAIELLPLTGEADFAQDQLAGSPSEEDFPDPDAVEPALAITSCGYQLGTRRTPARGSR